MKFRTIWCMIFLTIAMAAYTSAQPDVASAQSCPPGLGNNTKAIALVSGLSAVVARGELRWSSSATQQIKINGGGGSRIGFGVVAGEGSGYEHGSGNNDYRITGGLLRRYNSQNDEGTKGWYLYCEGKACNQAGRKANYRDYTWSDNTSYRLSMRRVSAGVNTTAWIAQLMDANFNPVGGDPIYWTLNSTFSGSRLVGGGFQQRGSGSYNSIGHGKLINVAGGSLSVLTLLSGGSLTADSGYWITSCSGRTHNVGTNTGCSGHGVGNGLSSGCY